MVLCRVLAASSCLVNRHRCPNWHFDSVLHPLLDSVWQANVGWKRLATKPLLLSIGNLDVDEIWRHTRKDVYQGPSGRCSYWSTPASWAISGSIR